MENLKEISKIPGLEDFHGYYAGIDGHIYSTRLKKLGLRRMSYFSSNHKRNYKKVILCSKNRRKAVYVHVIIGKLFLPKSNLKRYIVHRTDNLEDNSVANLTSIDKIVFSPGHKAGRPKKDPNSPVSTYRKRKGKERTREEVIAEKEKESILSDHLINELKILYQASLEKGLAIKSEFDFINEMVGELIDEYSNRKGLKKIIHQIKQR
jgi:hypothetical protein